MHHSFLKRSRARVAVQAFPIVIWFIKLDVCRCRRLAVIVDVDMLQPAKLCLCTAEHGVVGVAGVTGLVRGYAMILEMCACQMPRIVNPKASPIRLHDVARETEFGAL